MSLRILLILIFLPVVGRAQFAPFPTPGMQYGEIYVCNPFDCAGYVNYSMGYIGDTTICGVDWNVFNYTLLRAEQGKYYYYIDPTCSDQALVYDFSKGLGDTVLTYDLGPLKVTAVGELVLADGSVRKKMTVQTLSSSFPITYTWVDGIGDIENGFLRYSDFEGGQEQLICVRDSSGILYHNPAWNLDCDSLLCPLPRPIFKYGCTDQIFQFINLSQAADHYFWDFGDGDTSTTKDPTHVYANSGCYEVKLTAKSGCLPLEYSSSQRITVDAPTYWKKAAHQPPAPFLQIQFLDAQKGWAISPTQLWKTVDGGVQWDSVAYPGPARPLTHIQFKDFEHGVASIRMPNSIYDEILWTNDGINWSEQMIDDYPGIDALERVNDSVAVASSQYQGIFVTKNFGQTWINIPAPNAVSLIEDFVSIGGDTVYFIGVNQLFLPYGSVFGKSFDALHWEMTSNFEGIAYNRISFVTDQRGWRSNGGAIYQTLDGGANWTFQTYTPFATFYFEFADSLHGWACGYQTGIYGTDDGGQTWIQQACVRTEEYVGALSAVSADQAYVMTKDGLFEFTAQPEIISVCETSATVDPDRNEEAPFSIQPNPATDFFNLHWSSTAPPDLELGLFNIHGREVAHWKGVGNEAFSVAQLPAGCYLLRVLSPGNFSGKKLIICR